MIARLRGQLVANTTDALVIDVGGVGYRVLVPQGVFPQRLGDQVVVHTHLAVREDALTLFGFPDEGSLALFERLLGVNGIGPKLALSALGTLSADGLREAIVAEDVKALVAVPGLGRKTAQRLILELGGNLADDHVSGGIAPTSSDDPRMEVRLALAALGYEASEITHALHQLDTHGALHQRGTDGATDRDALLRHALQTLAGGQ